LTGAAHWHSVDQIEYLDIADDLISAELYTAILGDKHRLKPLAIDVGFTIQTFRIDRGPSPMDCSDTTIARLKHHHVPLEESVRLLLKEFDVLQHPLPTRIAKQNENTVLPILARKPVHGNTLYRSGQ
jgi:hypothetical protein